MQNEMCRRRPHPRPLSHCAGEGERKRPHTGCQSPTSLRLGFADGDYGRGGEWQALCGTLGRRTARTAGGSTPRSICRRDARPRADGTSLPAAAEYLCAWWRGPAERRSASHGPYRRGECVQPPTPAIAGTGRKGEKPRRRVTAVARRHYLGHQRFTSISRAGATARPVISVTSAAPPVPARPQRARAQRRRRCGTYVARQEAEVPHIGRYHP